MYYRFTDSSHVVTEPKPQVFNSHQHFFQKKGATAIVVEFFWYMVVPSFEGETNRSFLAYYYYIYPFFIINKVFNRAIKFFLHFTDLSHKKGKFMLAPKLVVGMVIILLKLEKNRCLCNNTVLTEKFSIFYSCTQFNTMELRHTN